MDQHSYLSNADGAAIEELYQQYLANPDSVEFGWRKFFEGFDFQRSDFTEAGGDIPENLSKEFKVINLINGYRSRGHLFTKTNPVRERRQYSPTLDIENFGLSQADLNTVFQAGIQIGIGAAKLSDIVAHMRLTYCQSVGVEYMYIRTPDKIKWLQDKIEINKNQPNFSINERKNIFHKLNQAVVFENFLHTKFTGQKRFSLEGCEALIPALDAVIQKGASLGAEEFVMGMAHRGRLNVLANILNKTYSDIFSEFEGKDYEDSLFDGDVKYHLGYTTDIITEAGKKVHLSMCPNPSHLEAVDPVVEGVSRAKLNMRYGGDRNKLVPILIHGDASIAGQGVVYEVVQMAHLDGYQTGGTIHIVVNNQIGFTTNFMDARSSTYCTDVAKVTLCPVFHVNADDVEAVVNTIQLAMEYRQLYHKDVFIDLLGYRKYGHNEGDEPRFTQPLLYKLIEKHQNPREIYYKKLTETGVIEANLAKEMENSFKQMLQERLNEAKQLEKTKVIPFLEDDWDGIQFSQPSDFEKSPDTGIDKKILLRIGKTLSTLPKDKKFFKKIEKIIEDRQNMIEKTGQLDWGMAELMAYGSLLMEGFPVRISGQDVERGTFSHRHAVLKVEDSEEEYIPLTQIGPKQARFAIYNSFLSEYAVLGFDYGYSLVKPNGLTVWEAQFGDFNNGAQIIIDQFISCAEDKWKRMSGIVMLLPHGYEGQGAEHSSGRMERFLQLCAEYNMQVVNCTTPANFFHVLRRQLHWKFRKPLIVFTPKSLLRHARCVSSLNELANGSFQEVLDDITAQSNEIEKIVFCTGKLYYELLEQKEITHAKETAIVRIEQLYPLPITQLRGILKKYKKATRFLWAQEEPENMGAWGYLLRVFREVSLEVVCRSESASPATGSSKRHARTQKELVERVFERALEKVS